MKSPRFAILTRYEYFTGVMTFSVHLVRDDRDCDRWYEPAVYPIGSEWGVGVHEPEAASKRVRWLESVGATQVWPSTGRGTE